MKVSEAREEKLNKSAAEDYAQGNANKLKKLKRQMIEQSIKQEKERAQAAIEGDCFNILQNSANRLVELRATLRSL